MDNMEFKSIKVDGSGLSISWSDERTNEAGQKFTDDFTRKMSDTPHPDLNDALEAMKEEFMDYFGFGPESADSVEVTGINLSTGMGDIEKISISGKKTAKNGQVTGMSARGIMLDKDVWKWEDRLAEKRDVFLDEVKQYMNGKSAQLKLDLDTEEPQEETEEKAA